MPGPPQRPLIPRIATRAVSHSSVAAQSAFDAHGGGPEMPPSTVGRGHAEGVAGSKQVSDVKQQISPVAQVVRPQTGRLGGGGPASMRFGPASTRSEPASKRRDASVPAVSGPVAASSPWLDEHATSNTS